MSFSAVQTSFSSLASNKAFAAEHEKLAPDEKRRYAIDQSFNILRMDKWKKNLMV
jgi:hypothetical protein